MDIKGGSERRQHPRYAVEENVFLTFRPNFDRIGRVKDISMGGASFEYVKYGAYADTAAAEVDIFSQSKEFHWPKIPCKVIYDYRVEEYPSFEGIETRRCGVQFGDLSAPQLARLNMLINNFAQNAAPIH